MKPEWEHVLPSTLDLGENYDAEFFNEALLALDDRGDCRQVTRLLSPYILEVVEKGKPGFFSILHEHPETVYRLWTSHTPPVIKRRILRALQDSRLIDIIAPLSKEPKYIAGLASKLASYDSETRDSALDALSDPRLVEQYTKLHTVDLQNSLAMHITACPDSKEQVLSNLQDADFAVLKEQLPPNDLRCFIEAAIDRGPNFAKSISRLCGADFSAFLEAVPSQLGCVFQMLLHDPLTPRPEIFRDVARTMCDGASNDFEKLTSELGEVSKFCGRLVADFLQDNLNTLLFKRLEPDFYRKLFGQIKVYEFKLLAFMGGLDSTKMFLYILFRCLPQSQVLSPGFYRGAIRNAHLRGLISESSANVLTKAFGSHSYIRAIASDRGALVKTIAGLDSYLRSLIITEVLGLRYTYEGSVPVVKRMTRDLDAGRPRQEADFSKRMQEGGFRAAQIEDSVLCRGFLADFLEDNFIPIPDRIYSTDLAQAALQINPGSTVLSLPGSADEFEIYHRRYARSRTIPGFVPLWQRKINRYFESCVLQGENDELLNLNSILKDALLLYWQGFVFYGKGTAVCPYLEKVNDFLQEYLTECGVWFSGRDSIPLYLAVKAAHFGEAGLLNFLKLAPVSRLVFDNAQTPEKQEALKGYIISLGIEPQSMLAVDTGFHGSVIKKVQELFGQELPQNIALLESKESTIRSILPRHEWGVADAIESLPKRHDRVIEIADGKPFYVPFPQETALLSWVTEHAVIRYFSSHYLTSGQKYG